MIKAILSGDIREIKKLKKTNNEPQIYVLRFRNGKYLSLDASKECESREYTAEEVEGLKMDHTIVICPEIQSMTKSYVCSSEE